LGGGSQKGVALKGCEVSGLSKRYRSPRQETGDRMPPNLLNLGAAPFGDPERVRLTALLRESPWPRGHMEIAELEGYLVALIAWPVDIASGTWLPFIWGGRGWKVPTKIAALEQYDEFIALIVGFMQELDRQLCRTPPQLESLVLNGLRGSEHTETLHAWGRGFMTALTLGSQGLHGRSASAIAAVHTIARTTSASAAFQSRTVEDIMGAVLSLMAQRPSRGPLGPLDPSTQIHATKAAKPARSRD
jgi:yecA family protein